MMLTDQERRALNELVGLEHNTFKNAAEPFLSAEEIEDLETKLAGN